MQQQLTSTKFSYIEKTIISMLEPLKSNQKFLRLIKYLNPYPFSTEYYPNDGSNTEILQPDISMPYDLIGNKDVLLTLFNPSIVVNEKIFIFFSHLRSESYDKTALIKHTFVIDLVIGYDMLQMGDELRNIQICDEICKCWDNQSFLADVGRIALTKTDSYAINDTYEGTRMFFTADNRRF